MSSKCASMNASMTPSAAAPRPPAMSKAASDRRIRLTYFSLPNIGSWSSPTLCCVNGACHLQKSRIIHWRCFDRESRTLKAVRRYQSSALLPAFPHYPATRSSLSARLSPHRSGVNQPSLPKPPATSHLVPAVVSNFLPAAPWRTNRFLPAFSCR